MWKNLNLLQYQQIKFSCHEYIALICVERMQFFLNVNYVFPNNIFY